MLAPGCQILDIFAKRSQVYGAQACHLACLVPLLWHLGGPWDDPWTLGSTGKDTVRSRLGFYRFLADSVNPFVMHLGFAFCCFVRAVRTVCMIFAALETGLKIDGFRSCSGSKARRVAMANYTKLQACQQLNNR